MAKKRRVTPDQARFLAICLIRRIVNVELATGPGTSSSPKDWMVAYFLNNLPEKWWDGKTSDASWEQAWEETRIQILMLVDCLLDEAKRVEQENPSFSI